MIDVAPVTSVCPYTLRTGIPIASHQPRTSAGAGAVPEKTSLTFVKPVWRRTDRPNRRAPTGRLVIPPRPSSIALSAVRCTEAARRRPAGVDPAWRIACSRIASSSSGGASRTVGRHAFRSVATSCRPAPNQVWPARATDRYKVSSRSEMCAVGRNDRNRGNGCDDSSRTAETAATRAGSLTSMTLAGPVVPVLCR